MKRFSINEICDYLEMEHPTQEEISRFSAEGLPCSFALGRGMGGFSMRMLLIPESVHIIVVPSACGRHGTLDITMAGLSDRLYRIWLSEEEIVSGSAVRNVTDQVMELIGNMEERPKVVTICTSCIDGVLHTDYSVLGKKLKDEYGIRFGEVGMFPFLGESKRTYTEKLIKSVYSVMQGPKEPSESNRINIVGKTDAADPDTDFYKVLEQAGYEVQEIHACSTLEDYDNLAKARLNVVLNRHSIYAAQCMEKKYGIPYIEFFECFDSEEILSNYKKLEEVLNCSLNVDLYYRQAQKKIEKIQKNMEGKSFATGADVAYNPVKYAYDWCRQGFPLKYFWTFKIEKADLPYYQWLREHKPDTYVYLATDTTMMKFIETPDRVDGVSGIDSFSMKNSENTMILNMGEEPYDFGTLMEAIDMIEESMNVQDTKVDDETENKNPFARNWSVYSEV